MKPKSVWDSNKPFHYQFLKSCQNQNGYFHHSENHHQSKQFQKIPAEVGLYKNIVALINIVFLLENGK